MPTTIPSLELLKRAIAIAEQIEKLQSELRALVEGATSTKTTGAAVSTPAAPRIFGRRKMSAAARARIAAAQRARWEKVRGQTANARRVKMLNPGVPTGPVTRNKKKTKSSDKK